MRQVFQGGLRRGTWHTSHRLLSHEGTSSSYGARGKSARFSPSQWSTMDHVRGVERRGEERRIYCENRRPIASNR